MNKLGYIVSAILFIIFQLLSAILGFNPSNTVWALIWLTVIVISSYISTIKNVRKKTIKNRNIYILLFVLLSIMLFAVVFIVIGAIAGVPECKLPLC